MTPCVKETQSQEARQYMAKQGMMDLEKQAVEECMESLAPVQAAAGQEEQDPMILVDQRINNQIEGSVVVAAKMNPGLKKWLPYWLVAGSVVALTNHIHAAPKNQQFPPELAMFAVFVCSICLMFRAMKN